MDWIVSLLFFLFRGEIQGPALIANARFIDDTLSLSQRVVNRNCLEQGLVPTVPPLRSVPVVPIV